MRDLQCTLNLDSNVRKTSIMVVKGTLEGTVMYDLTHIMDDLLMVVKSYITLSLMIIIVDAAVAENENEYSPKGALECWSAAASVIRGSQLHLLLLRKRY